jgi:tripeptide aminopeptidase
MNRLQELKNVLKVQTSSYDQWRMFAFIIRYITKFNNISYYTDNGNVYITKGSANSYPCVVAHMDTVHSIVEDLSLLTINENITGFNNVTMTQTGVGGDDKVGIFIALQCLNHFDNIKLVFFRDEEVGCQGSYLAEIDFFNNVNFVLQCDRRGNSDFIVNAGSVELSSKDFQNDIITVIKKYGYSFNNGMMTDVMALKEIGLPVSAANISCGYYNPHMENEYVNIPDVMNCLDMVINIIASFGHKSYYHVYNTVVSKNKDKNYNYNFLKTNYDILEDDYIFDTTDSYTFNKSEEMDYKKEYYYCKNCLTYEYKSSLQNDLCDFCMKYETEKNNCFL